MSNSNTPRPLTNSRYQAHLRTPSPDPDAGLRGLSHYERRLPRWRYRLRQWLIPLVRWETPHLARIQDAVRSPVLDSYFAMTANLGTHTFFMTALPICFWCGYADVGVALVHMLAAGVYLSGYAKDLVCLPRPLSPPLQRITMSGSAALEYGFPSTHTTNAVSVAAFCLHGLWTARHQYSPTTYYSLVAAWLFYATSISIGRMYCGMHGFFDVIFGAALGAIIAAIRVLLGPTFDAWIITSGWSPLAVTVLILALLVRFHPEPADNCPCFDDSVAFIGVVMGATIGHWHYARHLTGEARPSIELADMYLYSNSDLLKAAGRLVLGIVLIFLWRAVMKPLLLKSLPPIFRFISHYGLNIPRRYFLQARDYNTVPSLRQDDKVLPPASEIPEMLSSIRRRKRTISVGPQSEADAREMIANREQQRKEAKANRQVKPRSSHPELRPPMTPPTEERRAMTSMQESPGTPDYLSVRPYENQISTASLQVNAPVNILTPPASDNGANSDSGREDETNDRKMFSSLEKPRIRYDVEVITKLVVYAGIAWLAVEGNPTLFAQLGIS